MPTATFRSLSPASDKFTTLSDTTHSATNGNKIAVTAYAGQYANNQDLQQFFELENPAAYGSNYTFVSINGKNILCLDNDQLAEDILRWLEQSDSPSCWHGS
ncbi:hypothetical protein J3R83DRAFT_1258 [Lanmaoa asiatica]|nr:hypothetical protein J3R83DRAFT_1258 [Lanmaoa asiatica]